MDGFAWPHGPLNLLAFSLLQPGGSPWEIWLNTLRHIQKHHPQLMPLVTFCNGLVLLLVFFVPLERLFALRPQRIFRREFFNDLTYYFVNGLVPSFLLTLPLLGVVWILHWFVPASLHRWVSELPFLCRLGAAMVVTEIGYYWGHRWTHTIPFLWRFHALHHSAEKMDWLVNTRAHPLDMVFTRICGFVPLYAFGLARPLGR